MRNISENKSYIKFENKIIKGFIDLFAEKGENRITVNDIMKKAGVGRATFYLHFKSVDDVYDGVAKWIANLFAEQFYFGKDNSTLKNIEEAFFNFFDYIEKNENFAYALAYNKQLGKIVIHVGQYLFGAYRKYTERTKTPLYILQLNCIGSAAEILNAIAAKIRNEIKCSWQELAKWCVGVIRKNHPVTIEKVDKFKSQSK